MRFCCCYPHKEPPNSLQPHRHRERRKYRRRKQRHAPLHPQLPRRIACSRARNIRLARYCASLVRCHRSARLQTASTVVHGGRVAPRHSVLPTVLSFQLVRPIFPQFPGPSFQLLRPSFRCQRRSFPRLNPNRARSDRVSESTQAFSVRLCPPRFNGKRQARCWGGRSSDIPKDRGGWFGSLHPNVLCSDTILVPPEFLDLFVA